eukprot:scaffold3759_cov169-Amphora_coffeaeformis.AAC.12
MARELLENVKFIPVLQKQWKLLKEHTRPIALVASKPDEAASEAAVDRQEQAPRQAIEKGAPERISSDNSEALLMSYLEPLLDEVEGEDGCKEIALSNVMKSDTLSRVFESGAGHGPQAQAHGGCNCGCLRNPNHMMLNKQVLLRSAQENSRVEQLQSQVDDLQRMVQQLLLNIPSSVSTRSDGGNWTTSSQQLDVPVEIKVGVQSTDDANTSHGTGNPDVLYPSDSDELNCFGPFSRDHGRRSRTSCDDSIHSTLSRKKIRYSFEAEGPTTIEAWIPPSAAAAGAHRTTADDELPQSEITVKDPYAEEGRYTGIPSWAYSYGVHLNL